jgi:hypothetical protein
MSLIMRLPHGDNTPCTSVTNFYCMQDERGWHPIAVACIPASSYPLQSAHALWPGPVPKRWLAKGRPDDNIELAYGVREMLVRRRRRRPEGRWWCEARSRLTLLYLDGSALWGATQARDVDATRLEICYG